MTPPDKTESSPIQIDGRPYAPAFINEVGPFWLLFDTGCVGCRITRRVAERAGVEVDEGGVTCLPVLAIGGARWSNVKFGVSDETPITKLLGRDFDGFLGNGFPYYVREEYTCSSTARDAHSPSGRDGSAQPAGPSTTPSASASRITTP